MLCGSLLAGIEHVLHGNVVRLSSPDYLLDAQRLVELFYSVTVSDCNDSAVLRCRKEVLVVLDRHVLDLDLCKLTVLMVISKHFFRLERVDMDLEIASVLDKHQRIAEAAHVETHGI